MDKLIVNVKLMMSKRARLIVVSVIVIVALALLSFGLSLTGKAAYVSSRINTTASLGISFTPTNPKISEEISINAAVKSDIKEDFLLEIIVAENGQPYKYKSYQFSLSSGETNTFTFSYVPTDINEQNIVANLYNGAKTVLYGSKTVSFRAQSDIGPFDIVVDTPVDYIPTGYDVPFSVTMRNFGSKDVDANLIVDIFCFNVPNIERTLFIKINSSQITEKDFILPSCREPGQHTIKSSLIVYGTEYISSKSQYYEKDHLTSLDFLVPDVINLEAGASQELNIVYRNNNGINATDVKPIVFGIPYSWFAVAPFLVPEIKSGGSMVYIVKFNMPKNSEGSYPIIIGVSGNNLFGEKVVQLRVTGQATALPIKIVEQPTMLLPMILFSIAIIVVFVFLIARRKPKPTFSYKLSKIRREVTK